MYKLLQNENMKLYLRFRTWIMIALLILPIIGLGTISYIDPSSSKPDPNQWRLDVQKNIAELNESLKREQNPASIKQIEEQLKLNEYTLAHDVVPLENSVWSYTSSATGFITLISLFVIVVAGGIVANEFSWGTIKFLLVKPYHRSKVLAAKYLCVLQFALMMLVILFLTTFLFKGFIAGFDHVMLPHLTMDASGMIHEQNTVIYLLSVYGLESVQLLFMATISFMLSTIFRNASLAIGITFILQLLGGTVTTLLAAKYSWIKYSLFANTPLSMYGEGAPLIPGMTLGFSLIVLLVYFVLFTVATWFTFIKRDVTT